MLGGGNLVVTSFPVSPGTVLDASFFNSHYTSANGAPYGQWSGGTNTVTVSVPVCADGTYGVAFGCVTALDHINGTHPVGDSSHPGADHLDYGFTFTDGGQTGYGWFDIGLHANGPMPDSYASPPPGVVPSVWAAGYANAQDPVYTLVLNGYGYSTSAPVTAGVAPVPEPAACGLLAAGIGALALRRRRARPA